MLRSAEDLIESAPIECQAASTLFWRTYGKSAPVQSPEALHWSAHPVLSGHCCAVATCVLVLIVVEPWMNAAYFVSWSIRTVQWNSEGMLG